MAATDSSVTTDEISHLVEKKRDQGSHECEVLGTSSHEAEESSLAWQMCTKNPGHHQFIPAAEFSLDKLPQWCRKPLVLDYVKYMCATTVRLKVGYTSWDRPDGYCFSSCRGTSLAHFGSGHLIAMSQHDGPCQCPECESSPSPHQTCHKLYIATAQHVVFNTEEAKATQVSFFYDDEASGTDGRVKIVWGTRGGSKGHEGDNSIFMCVTHDETLVSELKQIQAQYKHLKFKFEGQAGTSPNIDWKNLCVVVSHPHGQPKKITVGEMKSCTGAGTCNRRQFSYSTATCRGSSGAFVLSLEFYEAMPYVSWYTGMMWGAAHSFGGLNGEYNKSAYSNPDVADFFTPISVRLPRSMLWLLGGTWMKSVWCLVNK
ncbi:hypothetical protein EGW08_005628 [Elysia chlorotica]|uniref:Uncharacterized protein n=1 Tax=Elysia chlorotica TaxID=188477 RepID=A0A433TYI2_ELYCH|nr:hypothetical protein EGW08_005628 [Elysia chlorotica]